MPRTMKLPALAAFVLFLAPAAAQAACGIDDAEALRERDKRCSSREVAVTCNDRLVNLGDVGAACCVLPGSSEIEWRCGDQAEAPVSCPDDADVMLVQETRRGAKFTCLGKPPPPPPPPDPPPPPPENGGAEGGS